MYMKVVKALDPELFAQEFNKVCEGFNNPQVHFIDHLTAYVYGEEGTPKWEQNLPDDPVKEFIAVEEDEPEWKSRKCAECGLYEWGRRCLNGEGYKRPTDCACEAFLNETLTEHEIEELKRRLKEKRAA